MSILYDDAREAIAEGARRVLAARGDAQRLLGLLEKTGAYDTVFWDTVTGHGWAGLAIPEAHGGPGLGLVEMGIVAQATGATTAGAPFLTAGYGMACALLAAGAGAQWLSKLASGEAKAAAALTEGGAVLPDGPAAIFAGGTLSGVKPAVVGGLVADIALVWASHHGRPALVLAELDGVRREPVFSHDNSRCHADLTFAQTPAILLSEGPDALALGRDTLARMAVATAHEQVGGAEALLHAARDYALARKAFGQPIGAFQSVKHRLAELYGLVEIARANAIHAAAREGMPDFFQAAAAARISATEAYDTAARDCVQVHGGIGVTWEAGLHLHTRRARSLAIEQGNLFFWEDALVEELTGARA